MQYTVKKPINNNILRVVDPTGCELIVTGRGLGFGAKPGYKLDAGNGGAQLPHDQPCRAAEAGGAAGTDPL